VVDPVRTEEQQLLSEAVAAFFAEHGGVAAARELIDSPSGYDPAVWRQLAGELELPGLAIPESFGGGGFSRADQAVVMEQMGRVLLSAPFLASAVLAVEALLASGDEAAMHELLPGIAAGEVIATLAPGEARLQGAPPGLNVQAARDDAGWRLSGATTFVLDGCVADLVIVYAGSSLFLVRGDAPGLRRTRLTTLDLTRRQARLDFDATPATLIGMQGSGGAAVHKALELATIALAAEQVGGAQRCLELSLDYAKTRVQFGKPIGSFQAIKHRCADMLLRVESARSAARYAAAVAAEPDSSPARLAQAASLAGAYCAETFFWVAAETVQVHGGMGFTWEHDAQLYFRRAKSGQVMFGTPVDHRRVLAAQLGFEA
jgi:alkylation response protein AidB-like acyl-CoA dehydrogenase